MQSKHHLLKKKKWIVPLKHFKFVYTVFKTCSLSPLIKDTGKEALVGDIECKNFASYLNHDDLPADQLCMRADTFQLRGASRHHHDVIIIIITITISITAAVAITIILVIVFNLFVPKRHFRQRGQML